MVRVICLYALRYEKSGSSELRSLKEALMRRGGLTDQEREFINRICSYGGSKFRETDLFLNKNPIAITKRILKGLKVRTN